MHGIYPEYTARRVLQLLVTHLNNNRAGVCVHHAYRLLGFLRIPVCDYRAIQPYNQRREICIDKRHR